VSHRQPFNREGKVRIATWNMGFNDYAYRPRHDEAWRFLVDELQPDLALVQEAIVPEWAQRQFRVAEGKAFLGGTWGSAVLSLNPVEKLLAAWERGSVVAARVDVSPMPLVAVSLQARVYEEGVIRRLTETFSSLESVLQPPFVVGGDFNTFRSAAERYGPAYGHGPFWENLDREFWDCHWNIHHVEEATFWGRSGRGNELQDDHILVDRATGETGGVSACHVIADERVRQLSDHGPIIAEVDFGVHAGT
jgi:hypothetical protein